MQADVYNLQAKDFAWQPVSPAVGAVRNDNALLIGNGLSGALSTVLADIRELGDSKGSVEFPNYE